MLDLDEVRKVGLAIRTCRWCRTTIVEGWEKFGDKLIAPWTHQLGGFMCLGNSTKQAEPADERWENVFASIGSINLTLYPHPIPPWMHDLVEFRIGVVYNDEVHYTVIRLPKQDLTRCVADMYKITLDEMIVSMDKHLEELYGA